MQFYGELEKEVVANARDNCADFVNELECSCEHWEEGDFLG